MKHLKEDWLTILHYLKQLSATFKIKSLEYLFSRSNDLLTRQ